MRCLPVAVLVGSAEARHPKRHRISKRSAEVSRSGAGADRRLERVNDRDRIVTEQFSSEHPVLGPVIDTAACSEQFGQFAVRLLAQRNEINWLTPCGRFLGAAGRHHLADDGRQHSGRVLPADQVEALERFIDEIERVSSVGERPLGFSREQGIGEHSRREPRHNFREQSALGRLAMTNHCPTPQPTIERCRIGSAFKRRAFPPWRLPVAIGRHAARALEQGEIGLLLWQHWEKIGERG